jgi:hypothetical protein
MCKLKFLPYAVLVLAFTSLENEIVRIAREEDAENGTV